MSYCRWSCENFKSDVYAYADCYGGYTTHVASKKLRGPVLPDPPLSLVKMPIVGYFIWKMLSRLAAASRSWVGYKFIGGPHDGESFNDPCLEGFYDRLVFLRTQGYNVPQYALDRVREEMLEDKPQETFQA